MARTAPEGGLLVDFRVVRLVADFSLDDLSKSQILILKPFERLHQRLVAEPQLLCPTGHDVDQGIRVRYDLLRFLKVIVSHNDTPFPGLTRVPSKGKGLNHANGWTFWQTIYPMEKSIRVGRTTTESRQQAEELAEKLVRSRLVACAQVDGPLTSIYHWKDKVENSEEWGLTLKFTANSEEEILIFLQNNHPYDEPQWVHWEAKASEGYANWVRRETLREVE